MALRTSPPRITEPPRSDPSRPDLPGSGLSGPGLSGSGLASTGPDPLGTGGPSTGSTMPCLVALAVEQPDDYAAVDRDCFRAPVRAQEGERIGRVSAVVAGPQGEARWFVVATGLRSVDLPVPVEGVVRTGDGLLVPFPADVIRSAPQLDPDVTPGSEAEAAITLHYAAATASAERGRDGTHVPEDDLEDVADLWPAHEVAVDRAGRRVRRWLRRQERTAS